MKKHFNCKALGVLMFAAFLFVGIIFPQKVTAAPQYQSHLFQYYKKTLTTEIQGARFWYNKSLKAAPAAGKRITVYAEKSDESLQNKIVSNGTYVYYAVQKKNANTTTIYLTNLKTKAKKTVCTYKSSYGTFCGYYNSKVYLSKPISEYSADNRIVTYDVKSKKYKTIKTDVRGFTQYGRYFVYFNSVDGAAPKRLYVYNAFTGKTLRIATRSNIFSIQDGKLYYVEYNSSATRALVRVCSLTGSAKKSIAVIDGRPGSFDCAFGPQYVIVGNFYAKLPYPYTKITYSTGKKTASSETEYSKLYGN